MINNVPDDWNDYYVKCERCGHRWHLSEGQNCEKCEEQLELEQDDLSY